MLQENILTGMFFILGLLLGHILYPLAAIVGSLTGTITAHLLNFDKDNINRGIYGFSPALVAVALIFLYSSSIAVWLLIILGSIVASIVQHIFYIKKIPAFTFPFILVVWIIVFIVNQYLNISPSSITQKDLFFWFNKLMLAPTNGFGEVIFQSNYIIGIIFFIGVLINNRTAALYGLIASFVGAVFALFYGQNHEQIQIGLFGFNALLTAIVFSGNKKTDIFWVFLGVVITILLNNILFNLSVFNKFGGVFTFPFVAGTWITLLIQKYSLKSIH